MSCDNKGTEASRVGAKPKLSEAEKAVMRSLATDKKRKPEELAVGFGVSFNTVRGVLGHDLSAEKPQGEEDPPAQTSAGD